MFPKSLMDQFARDMTENVFGNPHSASASSQLSTQRVEDVRLRLLQFFHADPDDFDLIFVANATAGIKLVVEGLRGGPGGFDCAYHVASHTSIVGIREEARKSVCVDDRQVRDWLDGTNPFTDGEMGDISIFAYPAQSNMSGERFPLEWASELRKQHGTANSRIYTLLDAASLAATSPLHLGSSEEAPDFTVVSLCKMFGFPDLGALIVRRQAEKAFRHRKYFGGGTVDTVVCLKEQWHAPKSRLLHERLEDGTLPVHSIIALDAALDVHERLFGSMHKVSAHTVFLANRLYDNLLALKHFNGRPVCVVYSPSRARGPVVAFNMQNHLGAWISLAEVEKLASLKNMHIRTGGVCNPGGIASALGLGPWEIRQNFSAGFRCGNENGNDITAGKPTGVIRASLGAMSTISDVDRFVAFIAEFYCDSEPKVSAPATINLPPAGLHVTRITVYPIKSCGGYDVPESVDWEVRKEGLAWDREWCLVHRGSGQALSQKRHAKMALLRPTLDFDSAVLRVLFLGQVDSAPQQISIPLSNDPSLFLPSAAARSTLPRVCGEEILPHVYASTRINDFFSEALGVPCSLVRFPPGGQGKSMRHAKAHVQKHQRMRAAPPGSEAESAKQRILLSNESPVLAIHQTSLDALNTAIAQRGCGQSVVAAAAFRANIVVGPADAAGKQASPPFAEDEWSAVRIGRQHFATLGACRRCHMVCINQDTAEKSEEPFVTLSKTRRFDGGKVFFGIHMAHVSPCSQDTTPTQNVQFPTIKVGDAVQPDFG